MRRYGMGTAFLLAFMLGLTGCKSTTPMTSVRTPIPEAYALPPSDDTRFTQPMSYPKEYLNQQPLKSANNSKLPSQQPQIAPTGGPMGRSGMQGGMNGGM